MSAVRMLAGHDIRRRWRSVVALTLLVSAVGTVVLATAAGGRRSNSALHRFNVVSRSSDVEVSIGFPKPGQLTAFRHSPGVAAFAHLDAFSLVVKGHEDLAIAAPDDSAMGDLVDRARLVKGRFANPSAPDEVTIGERLAADTHLRVGSLLDTTSYTQKQVTDAFSRQREPGAPAGPRVRLTVVGIVRRPLDLGIRSESGGVALLTPAFREKYHGRIGLYSTVLRVRTERGTADVPRVIATARKLWGSEQTFQPQPLGIETQGANNAIDVLTAALWIFAAVAALAGAVAIGIVLTRDVARVSVDQSVLRGLGITRRQRILAVGARAALIAGIGSMLAAIGAVLVSPLFPLGLARRADPDVGLHADWMVLGIGVALVLASTAIIAFVAAWRATRALSSDRIARLRRRTSPVIEVAARAGMPPTATNGLRMALQAGRGELSVPLRSAFAGAILGIGGITAVLVFAASLAHLQATPRLYGWTFDVTTEVGTKPGSVCVDRDDHGLGRVPGVVAVAASCGREIEVDGHPVSAMAFESLRGRIDPSVVAGRAPRKADEVAMGSLTLKNAHKRIGDRVTVQGETGATRTYRIVGRTVLPTLSSESLQPLADGAAFTVAGYQPLIHMGSFETHFLLLKLGSGADRDAIERLARAVPFSKNTGTPRTPVEMDRLQQINWFPTILVGLLTALALVAVGHALVTSVRRRRREIALLKTVGFGRRQVTATVAWQATTLAAVGLVVGIPIGLVVGRAVWAAVADGLGVSTMATLPAVALVLTGLAALALVNVIAFFPARAAARTRPAVALREE